MICNSGLRNTASNDNLSMKFYTYKKNPIKKSFQSKFSKKFKVVEFRLDNFKMFINTLWYDNVDDYLFFG